MEVTPKKETEEVVETTSSGRKIVNTVIKKILPATSFRENLMKDKIIKKEEKKPSVKSGGDKDGKGGASGGNDSGFQTAFKKGKKGKK